MSETDHVPSRRQLRVVCKKHDCPRPHWPQDLAASNLDYAFRRHRRRYHQQVITTTFGGRQVSIQRDPYTQKFPCPCGAPKHARREANRMLILCGAKVHPRQDDEEFSAETGTDDENANRPHEEYRRRGGPHSSKREATRSPSVIEEPRKRQRKGRAGAPAPSDNDAPCLLDDTVSARAAELGDVDKAGSSVTRPVDQASVGSDDHATVRNREQAPLAAENPIERQVQSLTELNRKAREEYIESLEEQRLVLSQAAEEMKERTRRFQELIKQQS
ncbi:hypothetical protein HDZ31DRAFT_78527 [Schizophyllum fasciatum]